MNGFDPNRRAGDREEPRRFRPAAEIGLVLGILTTLYVLASVMSL